MQRMNEKIHKKFSFFQVNIVTKIKKSKKLEFKIETF